MNMTNASSAQTLHSNRNGPESRPPLRFGIVVAQRADWPELVRRARLIEDLGFDTLNVVDHFYGSYDIMDPCHEAYTALAGIAALTSRLRLGVMVAGNTYRNPAFHLKQAVTVDHISGGRVDFGVGAGWLEREHTAYGFDFPSARERVERFAEAIEIWELLQRNERTSFQGAHYQIIDAPFEPKPVQRRLPLLIGTNGSRMMRLAARKADIWNAIGTPEDVRALNDTFRVMCQNEGRDPATVMRSVCPRVDMLASPEDFVSHATAYLDAGFTDFQIPWPRTDQQYEVMQQVARECIPGIRDDYQSAS
jgi:alkanesulfonate monooxygenase SsuD/methylene tetrahydromethanopterin reductase-like flavin-dependent oxidoreductase (luciferase family)